MRYFISDTHFKHANINRLAERPFSCVEVGDAVMIDYWNETVKPEDEVYHLGDVAWNDAMLMWLTHNLNGKVFVVPGNHDSFHPMKKKYLKEVDKLEANGWTVMYPTETLTLENGQRVLLNHFPVKGSDSYEGKYSDWLFEDMPGMLPVLHGHVHQNRPLYSVTENGTIQINLSVERTGYKPLSEADVIKLIATGEL